jgi:hypothetical protein
VARRERTRHLIELGGLVQKAGLVDLADDDRATLYGALLDCAARARGDDAGDVLALWKRRGKRARCGGGAFDAVSVWCFAGKDMWALTDDDSGHALPAERPQGTRGSGSASPPSLI